MFKYQGEQRLIVCIMYIVCESIARRSKKLSVYVCERIAQTPQYIFPLRNLNTV